MKTEKRKYKTDEHGFRNEISDEELIELCGLIKETNLMEEKREPCQKEVLESKCRIQELWCKFDGESLPF